MDKFNDIWKDRFNQGDIPDADWNTPDSEVWEAILPHVPNKWDRRPLFFWVILGLFLLAIVSMILVHVGQSPVTESYVPGTEEQPVLAFVEQSPLQRTMNETKSLLTSVSSANAKAIALYPSTQLQRVKNNTSTQLSLDNALQGRTEDKDIDRPKSENRTPIMSNLKAEQALSNEQLSNQAGDVLLLPLLKTLLRPVESKEKVGIPSVGESDPLDLPKPKRLKIAFQAGTLFWQHDISDQYTNDLSAFDFNYSDSWGWTIDVGASYLISDKLAVNVGLAYEHIQTHSGHNSNLSYDPNLEEGQAINDYDATLATPYGTAGASFRFAREEDLGEMPVDLLVDFHSKHTIQNISIPLGLQYYPMGQQRRWMPSVNVGLGTNYLFGISNQLESIETNHSAIKYIKTGNATFADPELNRLYFDVRAGVGLDFRLSSDFNIGIQGTFAKGINPIFEQNNYETRINRYQIQARISKQF
jgi:outer membrane protein W